MQPSEEIKSRLDIIDIIRDYIPLKAAGANFRALCPFHNEKSPSFMVSPEKQIFHCFGCGEGGDIFSFVMKIEGVDFIEALRILAPKAGVQLKKQNPQLISLRNKLLDILDISKKYYNQNLLENNNSKNAREYLKQRGLKIETIKEWEIGYSNDRWDNVINFLKQKGFNDNEIFQSGMSVKSSNGDRYYDRFRGRIMFPINNANGNIVAFSARISPEKEAEEKMGKYINSPQTEIYNKSIILFGLDRAKINIKKEDEAVIVEGQMDVITAYQAGFKNTIASSGTALTEEQVKLIKRFTENISLAFDMDKAGELAVDRGITEAMKAGMNIRVIEIPNSKDPDECIKKDLMVWQNAVKNAKLMMQYYFDKILLNIDLQDINQKKQATQKLLSIILKINNKIEQDFWLKELSQKIDIKEELLREAITKNKNNNQQKKYNNKEEENKNINQIKKISREEKISELLLALIMRFSFVLEYLQNNLQTDKIIGNLQKTIYKNLIFYYTKNSNITNIDYDNFKEFIKENKTEIDNIDIQFKMIEKLIFIGEEEFFNIEKDKVKDEAIKLVLELNKSYNKNKKKIILKNIIIAEKNNDQQKANNLIKELKILSE